MSVVRLSDDPTYAREWSDLQALRGRKSEAERQQPTATIADEREATARRLAGQDAPQSTHAVDDLALLNRACVLKEQALNETAAKARERISTEALPQHKANVKAVLAKLKPLLAALETHDALIRELSDGDALACHVLRPMFLNFSPAYRNAGDFATRVESFAKEAAEYGLV
jgi:hypothetical protein